MNNYDNKNKKTYNLFRTNIKPNCEICQYSLNKDTNIFCSVHKKIMFNNDSCCDFTYCPLKRTPKKKIHLKTNFTKDDFKI